MKNAISILFLSLNWAFGWLNADDAERQRRFGANPKGRATDNERRDE